MPEKLRIFRLDLTGAELVVLDGIVRGALGDESQRYSPARRGLHAKVGNKAAQDRYERGVSYANVTKED
jgi:hypothetical protein